MAGAGLDPRKGLFPPFWKADLEGLDTILERIEQLEEKHGERFAPPVTLKRLVAQGRLGLKAGQGFYPYPQPDEGEQAETVKLETRGDVAIAWLANAPMNAISPDVIRDLGNGLGEGQGLGRGRRDGDRLLGPGRLLGRRRHQGLHPDGRGRRRGAAPHGARAAARVRHRAASPRSPPSTRSPSAAAASWRWPATCGSPPRRRVFGQPEIKLGIVPGFGGTQRLPRLVGPNKALEMNLVGDAILAGEALESGLANRVVPDHELFETALMWARKLAGQAPDRPRADQAVSHKGDLDEGIEAEKQGFATAFASEDAKEGIGAFLGKRTPKWSGK